MKKNFPGYTLIEMLITVMIIGIVMPIIFNVAVNSMKTLSRLEQIQLETIQHQRLKNRMNEDFHNMFRIVHLDENSIGFTTVRNNTFQDLVEYFVRNDTLFYKLNGSSNKILFTDLETADFEFKNYDDTPYTPGGDSYTMPEMNSLPQLIFNYSFQFNSQVLNGKIKKLRAL